MIKIRHGPQKNGPEDSPGVYTSAYWATTKTRRTEIRDAPVLLAVLLGSSTL